MTGGAVGACSHHCFGVPSSDGETMLQARAWDPDASAFPSPRAVVQIVHGMSEHMGRYDAFARFLARRGFAVVGHDQIGHGKSAPSAQRLGKLPAKGGKELLLDDIHAVRERASALYPEGAPYVLFGHSMGSFEAYAYLARHAEGVAGAVLSGTGRVPTALSRLGNALSRALAALRGEDAVSPLIHSIGAGAYAKRIEDARTPFDWLCTDPAVVDVYIADELCGATFSVGGYATLTDLTYEIATPACAARIPRDLPILLVSGALDPVGDNGAGVERARGLLVGAGARRVTMKLYPGMRHEILNEPDGDRVREDVLAWMEREAL